MLVDRLTFSSNLFFLPTAFLKDKLTAKDALTPFEEMKKKAKDKKKGKKVDNVEDDDDEDDDDDIPEGIDLNDPYFAEELAEINGGKSKSKANNEDDPKNKKKKKKKKKKAVGEQTEAETKEMKN